MLNNKSIIAIIPARSGSKGLPGKNIIDLHGLPLIAWTIKMALKSQYIDYILVSTDCPNIQSISLSYGACSPFLRPYSLSSDTASTYDVINHALDYCQNKFDIVLLLEPTSPIRLDGDIDQTLTHLIENYSLFDNVVTVGAVHDSPHDMYYPKNNFLSPVLPNSNNHNRRQDTPSVFYPYGVAYCSKSSVLYSTKSFFTPTTGFFRLKEFQNIEIDSIYDLWAASAIISNLNLADEL